MTCIYYRFAAAYFLLLLIAGCSTSPTRQESNSSFIDRQISLANHHQQNNELATALSHWRIITLIEPQHPEAAKQQRLLESKLSGQANDSYKAGKRAFKSGNHKTARIHFLTSLAAMPDHQGARQKLREIQKIRMTNAQNKKSLKEQQSVLASRPLNSDLKQYDPGQLKALANKGLYEEILRHTNALPDSDFPSDVKQFVTDTHFMIVDELISNNSLDKASSHLAAARKLTPTDARIALLEKNIATAYYKFGRQLLSTDINQGIKQLEKSLIYDPSNQNVRGLLKQSLLMQKKLSKITDRK